jgi:hypothetical protein
MPDQEVVKLEGMTLEKLQIIIEAYTKPYRDELEKVKKQTTATTVHVEQQTSRMASSFKKIAGVVAAALSITAIVAFGKSCIDLGSQLAEVDNVIQQAVPSMEGRIDSFAKNAIQQFGMSEIAAKRYTGVFASMARGFKFSEESAASMGISLTGLAADVASFYDTSQAEAFTKLKSIFTGETETLKDLGIVMTQTALDAYALENGYGKTTKAMSEAEKVALRYAFVQEKLRFAQGDFARTSGSWANQVRILSEQFNALKATIGQGLINAFTPVIQVINLVLAKLQTLASYFKAFTSALFGNAGGVGDVSDAMGNAAGASGTVADNLGNAAKSAKKLKEYTLGIDELNVFNPDDGDGGDGTGGAGVGGVPDFGNFSGELFSDVTINPAVEEAAQRLKGALDAIKIAADPTREALKRLWDEGFAKLGDFIWTGLKDFYHEFLVPLGKWTLGTGIPMFADAINNFLLRVDWTKINKALRNFWQALEPFAEKVGEGLLKFFQDLLNVGASFINIVVPGGLNGIANAIKRIDPEQAKAVGYGIGIIATSVAALKITKNTLDFFDKFKGVILAAGGASTFGITLTLSLVAATGLSWATALNLLDRYENGTPEQKEEIEGEWNKNKNESVQKNKWGMGSSYAQQSSATDAYLNDNAYKKQFESIKHWIEEGKKIRQQEEKDHSAWLDGLNKNFQKKWSEFEAWWDNTGIPSWWEKDVTPWFTAEKWSGLYNNIKTSLEKKWDETVAVWASGIQRWWESNVSPWFTFERWSAIYESVKTSLKNTWDNAASQWSGDISKWWSESVSPWFTVQKWAELYETIKKQLKDAWDNASETWKTDISTWWNKNVAPWFTVQKWSDLYETLKSQLKMKWDEASEAWKNDIFTWWSDDVSPWFTVQRWSELYQTVKKQLKDTWDTAAGAWKTDISDWWTNNVAPWFTLKQWTDMMARVPDAFRDIFKVAVNAAREQLNRLIDWLNDKFYVSFDGLEVGGKEIFPAFDVQLFTIPHIPAFADGGVINSGQLFLANEAGPELVGKYGSKSGVMNNKQIVDAVSEGVAVAVANVMTAFQDSGSGEPTNINLVVDGRTLATVQTNTQKRSGYSFRNVKTV